MLSHARRLRGKRHRSSCLACLIKQDRRTVIYSRLAYRFRRVLRYRILGHLRVRLLRLPQIITVQFRLDSVPSYLEEEWLGEEYSEWFDPLCAEFPSGYSGSV